MCAVELEIGLEAWRHSVTWMRCCRNCGGVAELERVFRSILLNRCYEIRVLLRASFKVLCAQEGSGQCAYVVGVSSWPAAQNSIAQVGG